MLVATYDLAIIEDYLAGFAKIKISIKKQNGVVVIFGEPWQLLLTGSAVPRIIDMAFTAFISRKQMSRKGVSYLYI